MRSATIMFAFAGFLIGCGLVAYFMAPEGSNPRTALYVSFGAGLVMIICGLMARGINSNRTVGMIGIHVGLIAPLLLCGLLAWRAYSVFASGDDTRYYLGVILTIMAVGSLGAFIAILSTRPPKQMRT